MGLIAFESLAAYETYRARLKADAEGRSNFAFAQDKRLILPRRTQLRRNRRGDFRAMIAVIFEAQPRPGRKEAYLDAAERLRPLLAKIDGFISIERFES